jgi:hypothetical protein
MRYFYPRIFLSLAWSVLFCSALVNEYRSLSNPKACDYGGACLLASWLPFVLPIVLFVIWKPEGRALGREVLRGSTVAGGIFVAVMAVVFLFGVF